MSCTSRKTTIILMLFTFIRHQIQFPLCHAYNLPKDITFERWCHHHQHHHPSEPSTPLLNFYRNNFHERRNKKRVPPLPKNDAFCENDAVYVLRHGREERREIVAALRLTRSKNDSRYTFLRSLCVSRDRRRQGLASRLLEESLRDFDARHCYCFASVNLENLYRRSGFEKGDEMEFVPKWLRQSYESMSDRWSPEELGLYIKSSSITTHIPHVVLLQHSSEISKKSGTGWLLDDIQYYQYFKDASKYDTIQRRMQLSRWIWSGRNDVPKIEREIEQLSDANRAVYLLWTTGAGATGMTPEDCRGTEAKASYIILDGTWQQARTMYRKIPSLWKLPRVSLRGSDAPASTYVLRGDYSGWRLRFSSAGDGRDLLCTAEVAAVVLDRCGDRTGADVIRMRLGQFQSSYLNEREG